MTSNDRLISVEGFTPELGDAALYIGNGSWIRVRAIEDAVCNLLRENERLQEALSIAGNILSQNNINTDFVAEALSNKDTPYDN